MKISYHHIKSPLNCNVSYFNGNLDYTPPYHKSVILFGTVARVAGRSTHDIKLSVPIDDNWAGGFNYTLENANEFDDIVVKNNFYNISVDQLSSTYQNHVLCNSTCREFWTNVMKDIPDIKPNAFQKFATPLSTLWPPMDALLLLVTVTSITCIVVKRKVKK